VWQGLRLSTQQQSRRARVRVRARARNPIVCFLQQLISSSARLRILAELKVSTHDEIERFIRPASGRMLSIALGCLVDGGRVGVSCAAQLAALAGPLGIVELATRVVQRIEIAAAAGQECGGQHADDNGGALHWPSGACHRCSWDSKKLPIERDKLYAILS